MSTAVVTSARRRSTRVKAHLTCVTVPTEVVKSRAFVRTESQLTIQPQSRSTPQSVKRKRKKLSVIDTEAESEEKSNKIAKTIGKSAADDKLSMSPSLKENTGKCVAVTPPSKQDALITPERKICSTEMVSRKKRRCELTDDATCDRMRSIRQSLNFDDDSSDIETKENDVSCPTPASIPRTSPIFRSSPQSASSAIPSRGQFPPVARALAPPSDSVWRQWKEKRVSARCPVLGRVEACGYTSKADKETNQDAFSLEIIRQPGSDQLSILASVFDGHGPTGEISSSIAADLIPAKLSAALLQNPMESLTGARFTERAQGVFRDTQALLLSVASAQRVSKEAPDLVTPDYGTTAVMSLLSGKTCFTANCGDSRAVLLTRSPSGVWSLLRLSRDHSPHLCSKEKERVVKEGARLTQQGKFLRVSPGDIPLTEARARGLSLNLSRALGHAVLSHYGISAEPECTTHPLSKRSLQIMVVASDGVWDVLDDEEILDVIRDAYAQHNTTKNKGDTKKVGDMKKVGDRSKVADTNKVGDTITVGDVNSENLSDLVSQRLMAVSEAEWFRNCASDNITVVTVVLSPNSGCT
eukprot:111115_1